MADARASCPPPAVPYTACKLVSFEILSNKLTTAVTTHQQQTADARGLKAAALAPPAREPIVLVSGLAAGAAAAFVSQPFDLLLTRLCGTSSVTVLTDSVTALTECVIADGFRSQLRYLLSQGTGAFAGLGPRIVMISVMTSCQFFLYDTLRKGLHCTHEHYAPAIKP